MTAVSSSAELACEDDLLFVCVWINRYVPLVTAATPCSSAPRLGLRVRISGLDLQRGKLRL